MSDIHVEARYLYICVQGCALVADTETPSKLRPGYRTWEEQLVYLGARTHGTKSTVTELKSEWHMVTLENERTVRDSWSMKQTKKKHALNTNAPTSQAQTAKTVMTSPPLKRARSRAIARGLPKWRCSDSSPNASGRSSERPM